MFFSRQTLLRNLLENKSINVIFILFPDGFYVLAPKLHFISLTGIRVTLAQVVANILCYCHHGIELCGNAQIKYCFPIEQL